ncbi:MAG: LOG family protein [Thermodesulfobacteriota bacterium]
MPIFRKRNGSRRVTPDELIQELHRSVDGLAEDGVSRADLKLLSRTLRELRHAFRIFDSLRDRPKVTVFGSARVAPGSPPFRQAEAFGREMSGRGWFVVTGAGEGIMKAAHLGAGRDRSIGVNILLPFEQQDNPVMAGSPRLIQTKYFFTRKLLFLKESSGIALFPGGFGTMDEAFETLTLLQTGKTHPFPLVLVDEPGGDFWAAWQRSTVEILLARGLISPDDLALYRITDSVEEAVGEIEGYYRVFHSSRFVGERFVIRVRKPIGEEALREMNAGFADLLSEGSFLQEDPLPEEADDPDLAHLKRIVFPFNCRNFGRLRLLIDFLNRQ